MISRGQVGETTMILVFIVLNLIVIGGIVWGVSSFYGVPYDVRAQEAGALADRIQSCARNHDFFSVSFNISTECGVDVGVLSSDHLVYVIRGKQEFLLGTLDFKNQCFFNSKNEAYPVCIQRTIGDGEDKTVIIVGSNQRVRGANV